MCGCSNFVNNDERDIITQDELSREFDFTGNRPSVIEVGETWEDPAFDFTGNRPSVIEVGETWEDPAFDFMGDLDGNTGFDDFLGKKAKARRQERKASKELKTATAPTTETTPTDGNENKSVYGGGWFGRNWHWLLIGAVVVGGGYYIYKKRK